MSHWKITLPIIIVLAMGVSAVAKKKPFVQAASPVEAGRYLILTGSCNDCHTPGWDMNPGGIPKSDWLTGVPVGIKGPWGTTYAGNLRLLAQKFTEKEFIEYCRMQPYRPIMPSYMMKIYSDQDLAAIYQFIKGLGPKGEEAPAYVPPGQEPQTPVMEFVMPPMEGMEPKE